MQICWTLSLKRDICYWNILENNLERHFEAPDRKAVSTSNLQPLERAPGLCVRACSWFTSVSLILTLRGNTTLGK